MVERKKTGLAKARKRVSRYDYDFQWLIESSICSILGSSGSWMSDKDITTLHERRMNKSYGQKTNKKTNISDHF